MKILLSISIFFLQITVWGKTIIVSNAPGFPGAYTDLQIAINSSSTDPGDILLVQGSVIGYGDIVVTKRLTIMGPGFFLTENPETQTFPYAAQLNSISFRTGSQGSIIQGMEVMGSAARTGENFGRSFCVDATNDFSNYSVELDATAITLLSNHISKLIVFNTTGAIIRNNFIGSIGINSGSVGISAHNNIIANVDVYNTQLINNVLGNGFYSSCVIRNNIFTVENANSYFCGVYTPYSEGGSTVEYNIYPGNYYPNSTNINAEGITGQIMLGTGSSDGRYRLRANSIAFQAGQNADDIGPFGGPTPYLLSGISLHPNIYEVIMPTSVTSGSGLKIEVRVKANN